MNFNEVIANRGLELAGRPFGDYDFLSPNDHVNRSQSTNDTYPSAVKLSLVYSLLRVIQEMRLLRNSFAAKGREFREVLKVGRTQLQDAVPMTLGQEFWGFATTVGDDIDRLEDVRQLLWRLNLGPPRSGRASRRRRTTPGSAQAPARRHRARAVGQREGSDRGHQRHGGVHLGVLGAQTHRDAVVEDLQRPAAAELRPTGGAGEINLPRSRPAARSCPGR
nr:lyase family protein [Tessaracoccus coleopterorum]